MRSSATLAVTITTGRKLASGQKVRRRATSVDVGTAEGAGSAGRASVGGWKIRPYWTFADAEYGVKAGFDFPCPGRYRIEFYRRRPT